MLRGREGARSTPWDLNNRTTLQESLGSGRTQHLVAFNEVAAVRASHTNVVDVAGHGDYLA